MDYAFIEEIYNDVCSRNKKEYKPSLTDIIIWIFVSICCAITSNVNCDGTGLHLQITVHEFLVTLIATMCLLVGLKNNTPIYMVPWLVGSFWNMVACQYFSFEEIASGIFYADLDTSVLGILLLLAGITSLGFRIYLWLKIFELTYFSKYEPEIKFIDECYDKNSELDEFESKYIREILSENGLNYEQTDYIYQKYQIVKQ